VSGPPNELVVVSLEAWDGVWRRNQHLVSRLLGLDPKFRVLFVEPAADPLHNLRRRSRATRGRGLRSAAVPGVEGRLHLLEPTKWLPRRLDPWADARMSASVIRAAKRLDMSSPVLWLNDPLSAELLRRTGWPALYDITDDWLLAQRPPRDHDRLVSAERYLLEHCRHVVVCSPRLLETKRAHRPEAITLIPNAVDVDAYRGDLPRPQDLPSAPVVLYVGTLHRDRLDVDLCAALASALGDAARFVLVGPVALDAGDRARLVDAGAVLLGAREHHAVPAYLKNADVLVVPHVVTGFTDSLDPIKVYEYLAAARPVVSTPVAGFRELDDACVAVVPGSGFVDAVRRALVAPSGARTSTPVATWDERAMAMRRVIDAVGAT
jgi:glycosyltransferase involved in cell wall biosynthesis